MSSSRPKGLNIFNTTNLYYYYYYYYYYFIIVRQRIWNDADDLQATKTIKN